MNLFQLGMGRHDNSIALFKKEKDQIELVHYWELERLTREKGHQQCFFDIKQAESLINKLIEQVGLRKEDIHEVWGMPDDWHETHVIPGYEQYFYHSVAHMFSMIFMNSKTFYHDKILSFCVDAGPDITDVTQSHLRDKNYYFLGCYINQGKIQTFPISSPGPLWVMAKRRYKLQEGTLMALASASKSRMLYSVDNEKILSIQKRSDVGSANDFVNKIADIAESITDDDSGKAFNYFDPQFTKDENKISMCMKVVHEMSIKIMERNIEETAARFGIDTREVYLAIGGGYGLNCPTNSHLMKKYSFKRFLAPPCINDSGISLGKGLFKFFVGEKKRISFNLNSAYYGDSDDRLEETLSSVRFADFIKYVEDMDAQKVVEDVLKFPIVWFNGRAEIGPRALCNRSLLGNPKNNQTKDILNQIKQRQWWRPVAPVILGNQLNAWFKDAYPSPYMLHTFQINEEKQNLVPAICHLDGTARVQTLFREDNPYVHEILQEFYKRTGVPLLCNTSLNDRGEPIINTISETLNFALNKKFRWYILI